MPTPKLIWDYYHNSAEWRRTRTYIKKLRRGICERCGKAGTEVHHKTALTLDNFYNDDIRINENNLQLLCKSCHDAVRGGETMYIREDLMFDENGEVIPRMIPPGTSLKISCQNYQART